MKKQLTIVLILMFALQAFNFSARAEVMGAEEALFGDIPSVYTATLFLMPSNKAPSIMTVISEKEIRDSGAKTLGELLAYVPEVEVQSGLYTDANISIRGLRSLDSNSKILFQVDGHEMNTPYIGDWLAWGLAGVKQVEIIRGPGSALYGDHAFAGVINLVMKTPADLDGAALEAGGGTLKTYDGSFTFGKQVDKDTGFRVVYDQFATQGSRETIIETDLFQQNPSYGIPSLTPTPGWEGKSFQVLDSRLDYKNFYLWWRQENAMDQGLKSIETEGQTVASQPGTLKEDNTYLEAGAKIDAGTFGTTHAKFWHDVFKTRIWDAAEPDGSLSVYDPTQYSPDGYVQIDETTYDVMGADANHQVSLFDRDTFLLGASYKAITPKDKKFWEEDPIPLGSNVTHYEDDTSTFPPLRRDIGSVYGQDVLFLGDFSGVAGARYDHYNRFGDTFNPRAGLVYSSPNGRSFVKVLYGTAYRAPSLDEGYETAGYRVSNGFPPVLKPEQIETWESNAGITVNDLKLGLSAFRDNLTNFIQLVTIEQPDGGYQACDDNVGGARIWGGEADARYRVGGGLELKASEAYLNSRDKATGLELPGTAADTTHAGFTWDLFDRRMTWFLDAYHASKRARSLTDEYAYISRAPAVTKVNTSLTFPDLFKKPVDLTLSVDNLFGKRNEYPDLTSTYASGGPEMADISRPGTVYHAKIRVRF